MTIDEKDLYWSEELNKHDHKKFEVEVINTVKILLQERMGGSFWNLKPTFQAFVQLPDRRALIDLTFDDLNIGLEVDEGHHARQKEADKQRELDIFERMSMLGRKNFTIKRVDVTSGYEVKRKAIDEFVTAVLNNILKYGLPEWDDAPGLVKYRHGDFIKFSDNFEFMTKSDLFNTLIQESKWGKASGDTESSVEKLYEKHNLNAPTKGYIQNTNPDKELAKLYPYKFYIRRQDDWNIKGDKTERENLSRVWYNDYASDFSTLDMYTNEENYKYTDNKKTLYAMFIGRGDKIKFAGIYKEIANRKTNFKKEKNGKIVQFTRVLKYERVSDKLQVA